jgi:septal ring factor EnvC (AmiA/AmiB activator)
MSYEPTTTTSNTPQKKDNRNVIYGVLIAALLGTWGYLIYDKSKSSEKIDQLQSSYTTVDSSRNEIQEQFNSSLARLDSLTGTNQSLTTELESKNTEVSARTAEIAKLKANINSILKNKNSSDADLKRARNMINELNGKIEDYIAQIDQLTNQNQELTARNEQITNEKTAVENDLAVTRRTADSTIDIASTLHASGINVTPINEKSGGKEKETTTAKRVDKLRISFNLDDNRVTAAGQKDLYVCVYGPDGQPITIPAYGSGTFNTRTEGEKSFTNKVTVNYENGKPVPVSFDWRQDQKFQTGTYRVEVYQNGFKIGEGTKDLKKGGLFS